MQIELKTSLKRFMKKTNGLILINKPSGYTSRDIVNIVSKSLGTKKVGHTGTLDPLASGLLVVLFGKYTKLVDTLTCLDKEYIAEIKLGVATDTLDITGNILEEKTFNITKDDILKVFASFIGKYQMEVPIYSAIKVNGKKLYEYARSKEEVKLPVKEVEIYDLKLISYEKDIIKFETHVSKGTYIRSLIRDICKKLNVLGTMNSLVRTKQGKFILESANTLDNIKNNNYHILDLKDILEDIQEYQIPENQYSKIKNGNPLTLTLQNKYLLMTYLGSNIALYKKEQDIYKPLIMY